MMTHESLLYLIGGCYTPRAPKRSLHRFLGPRHTATARDSSGVAEAAAAADATLLVLEIHMGIGV